MNLQKELCVIIPVHKQELTFYEKKSLLACKEQLSGYDCYLVFPEEMDISSYTSVFAGLLLKPVNPIWLSSIEKYNKMKLSLWFYEIFAKYNYMLTYELDAYIFNSNIEGTNCLTFDFIGAPFFEGYWAANYDSPFMKGCNSGFSIRNIQSCIKVLNGMKKYRLHWFFYRIFLSPISSLRLNINKLTKGKFEVFVTGRFSFYFADFHLNEDVIWSEVVPQLFPFFKIADPMSALKFSFEYNLNKSLQLNGGKMPLGCHAWYKHLEFWKDYIDVEFRKTSG